MEIKPISEEIHQTAVEKGWWEKPRSFTDVMMMIVTECAEAVEHYRNGAPINQLFYEGDNKPDGVPAEMADILIRVFDACVEYDIDIEEALEVKIKYNKSRPYRHGNKLV